MSATTTTILQGPDGRLTEHDHRLLNALASTVLQGGNAAVSVDVAEFCHTSWPDDADSLVLLARALIADDRADAAVRLLASRMLAGKAMKPSAWLVLAIACGRTRQFQKARRALGEFIARRKG